MASKQTKQARRYRRIKICLMLFSIAALLVWLAPTLIPTGYLHRRVHAAIAEMFDGTVELGEVQLSWSRGVRLSNLTIDDREVDSAFEVPLGFLLDADNHELHQREWKGRKRTYYAMPYNDYFIWGATAGMIRNLHERLLTS